MPGPIELYISETKDIFRELESIPTYKSEDRIVNYLLSILWSHRGLNVDNLAYSARVVIDTWLDFSKEFMLYSALLSSTGEVLPVIVLDPRTLESHRTRKVFLKILKLIAEYDLPILIQLKFSNIKKLLRVVPSNYLRYFDRNVKLRSILYAPAVPFAFEQASRDSMRELEGPDLTSDSDYWINAILASIRNAEFEDDHYRSLAVFYNSFYSYKMKIINEIEKIHKRIRLKVPGVSTFNALPRHLYRASSALLFNIHKYGTTRSADIFINDYKFVIERILNVEKYIRDINDIATLLVAIRVWEYTGITFDRYESLSTYDKRLVVLSNINDIKTERVGSELNRFLPPNYKIINYISNEISRSRSRLEIVVPSAKLLSKAVDEFEHALKCRYVNLYLYDIAKILKQVSYINKIDDYMIYLNESNARLIEEINRCLYGKSLALEYRKSRRTTMIKAVTGAASVLLGSIVPGEVGSAAEILRTVIDYLDRKGISLATSLRVQPQDVYTDRIKGDRIYDPNWKV